MMTRAPAVTGRASVVPRAGLLTAAVAAMILARASGAVRLLPEVVGGAETTGGGVVCVGGRAEAPPLSPPPPPQAVRKTEMDTESAARKRKGRRWFITNSCIQLKKGHRVTVQGDFFDLDGNVEI